LNTLKKYDRRLWRTRERKTASSPTLYDKEMEILEQARSDWYSLAEFRRRATRCIRYSDGEQWNDLIEDPDKQGKFITEKEYFRRQGKVPLIQNKIGAIVRNILGQYRSNADKAIVLVRDPERTEEEQVLTDLLQAIAAANQLEELDTQALNAFLHAGAEIQRISYRYLKELDRQEVYVENIDYNRIFFNSDVKDLRLKDLCRIGVIHDMTRSEFLSAFCKNEAGKEFLENRFKTETTQYANRSDGLTGNDERNIDFYTSYDRNRIRVFETWNLETDWRIHIYDPATGTEGITSLSEQQIKNINRKRIEQVRKYNATAGNNAIPDDQIALVEYEKKIEPHWVYRYLLSDGHCLQKGVTPYAHQEHPFIIRLFPMLSGNVYGIVHQTIDQQRMINRMIAQWDFIMGAGAKGVLMIPEDMMEGKTIEEFTDEWVRFNGVITYKPSGKHNHIPQQITANSVPVGIHEMLKIQLSLIQDISGVHGAIQGQTPASGTSGALYQQETQNASINTLDIMKTHAAFKQVRDRKILKTALQFYNGKRRIISSGLNGGILLVDPDKIRDIDFDTQIIQNTDTPAYRQIAENRMIDLVLKGMLDPMIYYKNSSDPTAKKIYESMKQMQEQQAQQQQAQPNQPNQINQIPPDLLQAAQQANPQALQMLQQAINP
jgi:hypothetical protein